MPEGRIAVGTTPTRLIEPTAKGTRLNLRFIADPANTQNVAVQHSRQVAMTGQNAGIPLTPGTIISLNYLEDHDIHDGWWGIAASGTQYIIVNVRGK